MSKKKQKKTLSKKDKAFLSESEQWAIKNHLFQIWLNRPDNKPLKIQASELVDALLYVKNH